MRPDRLLLLDMLEAIDEVLEATPPTRDAFDTDKYRRSHLLRQLQITGVFPRRSRTGTRRSRGRRWQACATSSFTTTSRWTGTRSTARPNTTSPRFTRRSRPSSAPCSLNRGTVREIPEAPHRGRSADQGDLGAREAGEVDPARPHLHAAHLVGPASACRMSSRDPRRAVARPRRPAVSRALPTGSRRSDEGVAEPPRRAATGLERPDCRARGSSRLHRRVRELGQLHEHGPLGDIAAPRSGRARVRRRGARDAAARGRSLRRGWRDSVRSSAGRNGRVRFGPEPRSGTLEPSSPGIRSRPREATR